MRHARPGWPHEKEEARQQKQARSRDGQRQRPTAPEDSHALLLIWSGALLCERCDDPAPNLGWELQRASRRPELLGEGLRDLPLPAHHLTAGSARGQMFFSGGVRPWRKAPIQVFVNLELEAAAIHRFAFSSVPQAPKRFNSPGNRRCISAM